MLVASPTAQFTFSTQATDAAALDAYCRRGFTVPEAVRAVLLDRGLLDAA